MARTALAVALVAAAAASFASACNEQAHAGMCQHTMAKSEWLITKEDPSTSPITDVTASIKAWYDKFGAAYPSDLTSLQSKFPATITSNPFTTTDNQKTVYIYKYTFDSQYTIEGTTAARTWGSICGCPSSVVEVTQRNGKISRETVYDCPATTATCPYKPAECLDEKSQSQGLSHWGLDIEGDCMSRITVFPNTSPKVVVAPYFLVVVDGSATAAAISYHVKGAGRYAVGTIEGPTSCKPPVEPPVDPPLPSATVRLVGEIAWKIPGGSASPFEGSHACIKSSSTSVVMVTLNPPRKDSDGNVIQPDVDGIALAYTPYTDSSGNLVFPGDTGLDTTKWRFVTEAFVIKEDTTFTFTLIDTSDARAALDADWVNVGDTVVKVVSKDAPDGDILLTDKLTVGKKFNVDAKIFYQRLPVAPVVATTTRPECLNLPTNLGSPAAVTSAGSWDVKRALGSAAGVSYDNYALPLLTWTNKIDSRDVTTNVNVGVTSTAPEVIAGAAGLLTSDSITLADLDFAAFSGTAPTCTIAAPTMCMTVAMPEYTVKSPVGWVNSFGVFSCRPVDITVTFTPVIATKAAIQSFLTSTKSALKLNEDETLYLDSNGKVTVRTTAAVAVDATTGYATFPDTLPIMPGTEVSVTLALPSDQTTYTFVSASESGAVTQTQTASSSPSTSGATDLTMPKSEVTRAFTVAGVAKYDFAVPASRATDHDACTTLTYGFPAADEIKVVWNAEAADLYTGADGTFAYTINMADIQTTDTFTASVTDVAAGILKTGFYTADSPSLPADLCSAADIPACVAVGKEFTYTFEGDALIELDDDTTTPAIDGEVAATSGCVPGLQAQLYDMSVTPPAAVGNAAAVDANGKYTLTIDLASSAAVHYGVKISVTAGTTPDWFEAYYDTDAPEYRTALQATDLVVDSDEDDVTGPTLYVTRLFKITPSLNYDLAPSTQKDVCALSDAPRPADVDMTASYLCQDLAAKGTPLTAAVDLSAAGFTSAGYVRYTGAAGDLVSVSAVHPLVQDGADFVTAFSRADLQAAVAAELAKASTPLQVCQDFSVPACLTVGLRGLKFAGKFAWAMSGISTGPFVCGSKVTATAAPPTGTIDPITATTADADDAATAAQDESGTWSVSYATVYPGTSITLTPALADGLDTDIYSLTAAAETIDTGDDQTPGELDGKAFTSTEADDALVIAIDDYPVTRSFAVDGSVRYVFKTVQTVDGVKTVQAVTAQDVSDTCAATAGIFHPTTDLVTLTGPGFTEGGAYSNAGSFTLAPIAWDALTSATPAAASLTLTSPSDAIDTAAPPHKTSYSGSDLIALVTAQQEDGTAGLCAASYTTCLTVGLLDRAIDVQVNWELDGDSATNEDPDDNLGLEGPTTCPVDVKLQLLTDLPAAGFPLVLTSGSTVVDAATEATAATAAATGVASFTLVNALPDWAYRASVDTAGEVYAAYGHFGVYGEGESAADTTGRTDDAELESWLAEATSVTAPVLYITRTFDMKGNAYKSCSAGDSCADLAGAEAASGVTLAVTGDGYVSGSSSSLASGIFTVSDVTMAGLAVSLEVSEGVTDVVEVAHSSRTFTAADLNDIFVSNFDNLAAAKAALCADAATLDMSEAEDDTCLVVSTTTALSGQLWIERNIAQDEPGFPAYTPDVTRGDMLPKDCNPALLKVVVRNDATGDADWEGSLDSNGKFTATGLASGTSYTVTVLAPEADIQADKVCNLGATRWLGAYQDEVYGASQTVKLGCTAATRKFPRVLKGYGPGFGLTHGHWGQNLAQAAAGSCDSGSTAALRKLVDAVTASSAGTSSYTDGSSSTSSPYPYLEPVLGLVTRQYTSALFPTLTAGMTDTAAFNAVYGLMSSSFCTASYKAGEPDNDNMVQALKCQLAANEMSWFRPVAAGFEWRSGWAVVNGAVARIGAAPGTAGVTPFDEAKAAEQEHWNRIVKAQEILAAVAASRSAYGRAYLEAVKNDFDDMNNRGEPSPAPARMCKKKTTGRRSRYM
ncbi:hypothetical protein HXX76_015748 [Chlamydomonas incerta]|uniref:Uncharacterized protein n=1 Tax=Chlamydomonas incerta TaxID=51695 RepID=A0A835VRI8_CHLIN|nr:hypothetical protein HXX76_015748 [Chlamydomonas incerta]|eukprot:KAG2422801.1 hypothetical protein HXX76_015748 [Chlamydomonas incerta]